MVYLFSLTNGLTIIVKPITHSEVCTVGLWLPVGARNEQIHQHGISHLVEHMFLKRTKTYSFLEIVSQIEQVGGSINAYTGYEVTAYHSTFLSKYYPQVLKIFADIFQNYVFQNDEFIKEKDVVIQEINESIDDHVDNVFDYVRQIAYPNQALGRNILGTIKSINQFEIDDLKNYIECNYYSKPILSIVGNVDPNMINKQCQELFCYNHKCGNRQYIETPAKFHSGIAYFNKQNIKQTHLVMLFPGLLRHDDNYYAQLACSNILGEGLSSRLFHAIREQHGLAYSISSFTQVYLDTGIFGIYFSTTDDLLQKCVSVIQQELEKIQLEIKSQELQKAIAQLNMDFYFINDSSYLQSQYLAKQLIYHQKILNPSYIKEKINCLSINQVQNIACQILSHSPAVAILGSNNSFDLDDVLPYIHKDVVALS